MQTTFRQAIRNSLDKWLFLLRGAEHGEIYLNQRRVFIIPSRPGLAFGLMLAVLFIGSVNYSLSLGFALTFLIAGCAIIDMHLAFRNLAHLHLAAGRVQPVFAGEEARFELHLINRTARARYAIWLEFTGKDLPKISHPVDVSAQSTCDTQLSLLTSKRGWLAAPRVRLHTHFPLGLFRCWSYWHPAISVLVYPHPENDAPSLPQAQATADEGGGAAGHDDFAGVRGYQLGDSMKRLAWRQIARLDLDAGGSLVTKYFEGGATAELCIDFSALPYHIDVELKLSRMTRWVLEAETRGVAYAFRLGDFYLPAALGPAQQQACLQALALYGEA